MKNFYKILGVHEHAAPDEIKKSYRKLSLKFHPDKNNGSEDSTEKFKQINEAYEHLSDNDKRIQHDQALAAVRQQEKIAAEMKAREKRAAEASWKSKSANTQSGSGSGLGTIIASLAAALLLLIVIGSLFGGDDKA